MKSYIFDANSISLEFADRIPEKWSRCWKEIKIYRTKELLLIEPLISETYYKNIPKHGKKVCKDKILWLKSLQNVKIHQIDDNDAIAAGDIKNTYFTNKLSLVDCFVLAIAKKYSATLFTTDSSMRDIARKLNINVDFLPLPEGNES